MAPPADTTTLESSATSVHRLPGDIVVISVPRHLGADLLERISAQSADWLVIDLSAVECPAAVSRAVSRALSRSGRRPGRTCAVDLGRVDVPDVPVFRSVGDACQAKVMGDAGFGPAWSPDPAPLRR